MVQALLNLILNARDAMTSSAVKCLRVQADVSDGRAFVRLQDSGSGIAAEYIGSIFDPFFTTKEDRREQVRSGFGLGLTVAETIVRDHGGSIDVSSAVGEGSAFTVWLPLDVSPGLSRGNIPAGLQARVKGKRVLVAENGLVLRLLLGDALRNVGCVVYAAASVEQSLNLMADGRHDVIVIGTMLPVGGVEKLLRAAAAKSAMDRPATIIVAEKPPRIAHGNKRTLGASAVLLEPVTLDSLYAALDAAVADREKRRGT
jgi:CheY-like chemotaxis protein